MEWSIYQEHLSVCYIPVQHLKIQTSLTVSELNIIIFVKAEFMTELLNGITLDCPSVPNEILLEDKHTEEKATQEISFYLIIGMMQEIIWTSGHSHLLCLSASFAQFPWLDQF